VAIVRYIVLPCHHYLNDCTLQNCGVEKVLLMFVVHESWSSVLPKLFSRCVLVFFYIPQYRRLWVWKMRLKVSIKTVVFGMQHILCKLQCEINKQADKRQRKKKIMAQEWFVYSLL
jgi:hypothetical protein